MSTPNQPSTIAAITDDVHTYLTQAPTSEFVQQSVEILHAWEGSDNLLWRVRTDSTAGNIDAVLKLYLDAGQARSRRQFDGHRTFAPLGIAPRPLWYDRHPAGLARQVLVYEWAPGDPLDAADPAALAALAQSIATVHSADPEEVGRFSPHPINLDYWWRVQTGSVAPIKTWLTEQEVSELQQTFDALVSANTRLVQAALPLWQSAPPTAVHGDLKLENCLNQFGSAVLLDWEMFGLGDPALEVATFLYLHRTTIDEALRDAWLEHYLAACALPGIDQRVAVYGRLLPFHSLCYLLDGLRTLPPDLPQRAETLAFLQETVTATLQEAAPLAGVDPAPAASEVPTLFAPL